MNIIYAEYNMYRNSIDIYTCAGYMLRIDCNKAEDGKMCIRDRPFNWRLAKNRTCCKASVFCIRYFRNYLYPVSYTHLDVYKRQDPGTYSPQHSDLRLLAIPALCSRVADYSPN